MQNNSKKIKNLEDLISRIKAGQNEFFVSLAGGNVRSSKNIWFDENSRSFTVYNEIDGTTQECTESQILTETNIGKALESGALFAY